MNASDCYVSLHRSEGFGLTMAEAMLLDKPVIATDYSGNLEFMTKDNSYLCPYKLVSVGSGNHPYTEGIWADPDIDQAALLMRQVFFNQEMAQNIAAKGKSFVEKNLSFEAAGADIAERLKKIPPEKKGKSAPGLYHINRAQNYLWRTFPFLKNVTRVVKSKAKNIRNRFR
jgi:glycosyltransferase involved in cell wall biosynthesis